VQGPITIDCDGCAAGKIARRIRREPRSNEEGPGECLAIDFHDFKQGFGGWTSLVTITDCWSGLIWDYYLSSRTTEAIIQVLTVFFGYLKRQFKIEPKVMEMDGELFSQKPEVRRFLEQQQFMRVEPSPPYTQALNSSGERLGGVIKQKIIAMESSSTLPKEL
jgi:transposase InsO family protein